MPSIFLCYRREDTAPYALLLHGLLVRTFGRDSVFMDIDALEPGVDFDDEIRRTLSRVDVMLVLIGRNWIDARDESGRRRLDDADDYVRLEIASALTSSIRVIPVLVAAARAPKIDTLPENIKWLSRRQAIELSDTRWDYDANRLIESLRGIQPTAQAGPSVPTAPSTLLPARQAVPPAPARPKVVSSGGMVFVGYQPELVQNVDAICDRLTEAGFRVWTAKHDLDFKKKLYEQVEDALQRAKVAVLLAAGGKAPRELDSARLMINRNQLQAGNVILALIDGKRVGDAPPECPQVSLSGWLGSEKKLVKLIELVRQRSL